MCIRDRIVVAQDPTAYGEDWGKPGSICELLDATGGNRLERWGETILIRPDPQVVWKTEKQSPLWAKADAIYHLSLIHI